MDTIERPRRHCDRSGVGIGRGSRNGSMTKAGSSLRSTATRKRSRNCHPIQSDGRPTFPTSQSGASAAADCGMCGPVRPARHSGEHCRRRQFEACPRDLGRRSRLLDQRHLSSTFRLSRDALPQLRGRNGVILNMASGLGLVGMAKQAAYSSAKAAIIGLTGRWLPNMAPTACG